MLHKFIQLTRRILKVLSVEYDMTHIKNSSSSASELIHIAYDSPNSIFNTIVEIHGSSKLYNEAALIYDRNTISILAYITETVDVDECIPIYSQHEPENLSKPYMKIISSIFNPDVQYTRGDNTYLEINIDDNNMKILDELLNYTDEELKLYISLL